MDIFIWIYVIGGEYDIYMEEFRNVVFFKVSGYLMYCRLLIIVSRDFFKVFWLDRGYNRRSVWLESRRLLNREGCVCCLYFMIFRLCLVFLNKWFLFRLEIGLDLAVGKRKEGKEVDFVRIELVDLSESRRGVCGWEEKDWLSYVFSLEVER